MKILKLITVSCLCFLPLSSHAMAGEQAGVRAPNVFQNNVESMNFGILLKSKPNKSDAQALKYAFDDIYRNLFSFVSPDMLLRYGAFPEETALHLACEGGHIFVVKSMLKSHNGEISQQDFDLLISSMQEVFGEHYDSGMDVKEALNFIKSRIH